MYWTITLLISLGGLAVCWSILSSRWHIVSGSDDPLLRSFNPELIRMVRIFHPILPGQPEYLDLKFSLLRHALAFFVSAGLLRLLDSRFWETTLLWLNLMYAGLKVWVYSKRKQELQEIALESTEREQLVIPTHLVRDSFVVVAYSVIAAASLYLLLYLDVPAAPAVQTEPPEVTSPAVTAPVEAEPRPVLRQQPKPDHGHIFEELTIDGVAPFSVSGTGDIYLVLDPIDLSDSVEAGAGEQQASLNEKYMELRVFLRSGKTFEADVPLGRYEVYYATGDAWYGEEELFGPDTRYCKCDETFDFTEDSQGYNGWTLTLTAVYNGNLDTDLVDESDFPK